MKDLFSSHAQTYARFRPHYPPQLFDFVLQHTTGRQRAWDCATGNGQAAIVLAEHFDQVDASDLSQSQLDHAQQHPSISYHLSPAEHTPFPDHCFDLITIATAYHWINWIDFEKEAKRVGKQGSTIAIWAYNILRSSNPGLNEIIDHFYHNITGPFWEKERSYVDNNYADVYFPFNNTLSKDFNLTVNWDLEALKGYLSSWSAVQAYKNKLGSDPLLQISEKLQSAWPSQSTQEFTFPLFLKLGTI